VVRTSQDESTGILGWLLTMSNGRYHWSVEYFEDLRNVNHCEFVLMRLNPDSGKFILETELRTWSELRRLKAEEAKRNPSQRGSQKGSQTNLSRRNTLSAFLQKPVPQPEKSPSITGRQWGGCVDGCNHEHEHRVRGGKDQTLPPPAAEANQSPKNENDDHALGPHEPAARPPVNGAADAPSRPLAKSVPSYLLGYGLSSSGNATPHEMPSDDEIESYAFPPSQVSTEMTVPEPFERSIATAMRRKPVRKATPEDIERWVGESGMGRGKQADALGDEPEEDVDEAETEDRSLRGSVY